MSYWWLTAIGVLIAGYGLDQVWTTLFKIAPGQRVRAPWKSAVGLWGRAVFRVGSIIIALMLVPWETFSFSQNLVVGGSLVVGLIVARLDHLIAALTGAASLMRIGETIGINGLTVTVEEKGLMRVGGSTPDGQLVSIGYATLANAHVINWTKAPFCRAVLPIHVCDVEFDLDAVYRAIDTVLRPDGQLNPKYSISTADCKKQAWRAYAGQAPDSNLIEIGIYTRFRDDLPSLVRQAHEDVWRACDKAKISLGQVGHRYIDNEKLRISSNMKSE